MNMKKVLFSLLTLPFCASAGAQDSNQIRFSAFYIYSFMTYENQKAPRTEEFVLDVAQGGSMFYSRWEEMFAKTKDSIIAKGGGLSDVMNATSKYPRASQHFKLCKNYPEKGKLTYLDQIAIKKFYYQEEMEKINWRITEKDSVVADYPCKLAECTFRGRNWKVWFTMDIPSEEGPWKLHGLPGLILYAAESKGDFSFECIEIKNGTGDDFAVPTLRDRVKCTREQLMSEYRELAENPGRYAEKLGGIGGGTGPDGKPIVYKPRVPVFLDY